MNIDKLMTWFINTDEKQIKRSNELNLLREKREKKLVDEEMERIEDYRRMEWNYFNQR